MAGHPGAGAQSPTPPPTLSLPAHHPDSQPQCCDTRLTTATQGDHPHPGPASPDWDGGLLMGQLSPPHCCAQLHINLGAHMHLPFMPRTITSAHTVAVAAIRTLIMCACAESYTRVDGNQNVNTQPQRRGVPAIERRGFWLMVSGQGCLISDSWTGGGGGVRYKLLVL